ncbi:MAG: hypothetical protein PHQ35_06745 [Phycisphaerae bacterium]|nr:hypothetical protein [Phycisphaerae bacterium]MDD5381097.1 hypothetical protein [Phycisphaerae bacterium]
MVFKGMGEILEEKKKKKDLVNYLINSNISAIDVNQGQKPNIHVTNVQAIDKFKSSLGKNEVCKLHKKERYDGPIFEIHVSGNKHIFVSYFSPNHQEDVFVKLLDKYEKYYIKFPSLKCWLDENLFKKQK